MVPESAIEAPEFETDRAKFLGRGRTPENPEALTRRLTNSIGAVLDPIFSLRRRVTILPNQRFQFALVTVVADSREAVVTLAGRYSEFHTWRALLRPLGPIPNWRCAGSASAVPMCKPFNNSPASLSFHRLNFDRRRRGSAAAPKVSERSGDKAFRVICRSSSS
jgi:Cellobiose phosphorylase